MAKGSYFIIEKNNKFVVVYQYKDIQTGKRKQKQIRRFDKKKEAKSFLIQERAKLNQAYNLIATDLKVYDYLKNWNALRKDRLSVTTYNYYNSMINNRLNYDSKLGNMKMFEVTPNHIEIFYSDLLKELSNNSAVKYHRMLSKAFGDAKRKQMIIRNPLEFVEPLKSTKSDTAQILTLEEAQKLIEISAGTKFEVVINLALGLGLRAGEICGLKWDKVDFKNNTILIDTVTFCDKSNRIVKFKEPKTKSSRRLLNVPETIMRLLKVYKLRQEPNDYDLLFVKMNQEPMSSDSLSRNFKDFIRANGFKEIRFHDLRHTNASLHLLAGTDLKVTSRILGHSTIGITADLYTHVLDELNKSAAINMNNMLYRKG